VRGPYVYSIKERCVILARYLIENKFAHFVGSDAHRSNHRPPKYKSGIEYLRKICSEDYFEDLCYKNAEKYIKVSS
jgi:tyrosine-protein phosphatase YwqE